MGQSIQTQFAIGLQSLPALRWFVPIANGECFFLEGTNSSAAKVAEFSWHPLHDEQIDATLLDCACAWLRRSTAMHVTFTRSRLSSAIYPTSPLNYPHCKTARPPFDVCFCAGPLFPTNKGNNNSDVVPSRYFPFFPTNKGNNNSDVVTSRTSRGVCR